jgi:hypothetical protein
MNDYVKQLEETNEKLKQLAEENSELVDLFKYVMSKSRMDVVLDASGDFTLTFEGNMVENIHDHRIKDFAKQFNGFRMKDKQAAHRAGIKETK